MKNKLLIALVILILGWGGYLFYQNLVLQAEKTAAEQELADLKDEKSKVETELDVLINSDLGKVLERTQVKLITSENDLC